MLGFQVEKDRIEQILPPSTGGRMSKAMLKYYIAGNGIGLLLDV